MKDPLQFNKILAALLIALAITWIGGTLSDNLVSPQMPSKNAYTVDTSAIAAAPTSETSSAPQPPVPSEPKLASADIDAGQKYAHVCATCHSFGKGEAAKIGPNLYGIIGAKHAHMAGYNYSSAMAALGDKVWTYAELNAFLTNPRAYISGTKMGFAGIKSDSDRANVIAWLRTLADTPAPLN